MVAKLFGLRPPQIEALCLSCPTAHGNDPPVAFLYSPAYKMDTGNVALRPRNVKRSVCNV